MHWQSARLWVASTTLALLFVSGLANAQAPAWPQFLGSARNGMSTESDLTDQWPGGGPQVLWRSPGGVGMSGIAIAAGRAITMWNSTGGQVVAALDAKSGEPIWSTPIGRNYRNAMGDGPRATPTIAVDRVYAYTGEGILVCLQVADGKIVWSKEIVKSVGGKPAEYGMSCSPLVVDDLVIVTADGPGSAVVAVNATDGKTRWTAVDGTPGYSSPTLLSVAGEQQLLAFTGAGLSALRPTDGKPLWQYAFKTPYDTNTATPISVNGNIFISAGENHGCAMLRVTKQGDDYTVDEVWESTNVKSVMRNEWQTSVLIDGHLYGFDNVGSAGPVTHLTCVNAQTGETVWRKTRFGKGNLVSAGSTLWITTMEGELVMVKATTDGYQELGRKQLFGRTRQSLSIADGKGYIRDDAEVVCIYLRQ